MAIQRCITPDDYRREAKIILHEIDRLRFECMSEGSMINYLTQYLINFQTEIERYEKQTDSLHGYGR